MGRNIVFFEGNPAEYSCRCSQGNSARAENKSSITVSTHCGLLPLILPQWCYISCARIHGPWIADIIKQVKTILEPYLAVVCKQVLLGLCICTMKDM
ncbi:hypothetical protein AQUCO_00300246v1 [Aquilegia coerulea]|uniref:Uncharacterized protein n=1 Tax=Aquilegia coerulea TaxID=218851 RepID=A0A2G5EY07_AQUCA|nr:hypothetical protein AQUCO_00300246v1 [Aquilegia coerulea]